MASIFTTSDKIKVKGPLQSFAFTPFYLQFVPGVVVDVVTHPTAFNSFGSFQTINSIVAIPHVQEGTKKTRARISI